MRQSFRRWLHNFSILNPIEQQQAYNFQNFLLVWVVIAIAGIPGLYFQGSEIAGPTPSQQFRFIFMLLGVATWLLVITPAAALWQLRRGHFTAAVSIAALGLLFSHCVAAYVLGIGNASVLIVFQIPIAIAGLLGGRRLLLATTMISIMVVMIIAVLELQTPPMAGYFNMLASTTGQANKSLLANQPVGMVLGFFVAVSSLLTILLYHFSSVLRKALASSLEREAELQTIRASLEMTVKERTKALQHALNEAQARSDEQTQLLHELDVQRSTIRNLSVPVIPVSASTLVIPLVGELDATRLQQLQEQSLRAIERSATRLLVLDITGVPLVDTQVAQGFLATVRSAGLLGAQVALVGIRPEVAQTMVSLGIDLRDVATFNDLQSALAFMAR